MAKETVSASAWQYIVNFCRKRSTKDTVRSYNDTFSYLLIYNYILFTVGTMTLSSCIDSVHHHLMIMQN